MTNTPESISYIQLNEDIHPIDAVSIEGKLISDFQEAGKIVQTISASSTHDEIPSAKCIYELVYGSYTPPVHDYSKDYLTIEANEDGLTASLSVNACEYCVDGDGNWKTLSAGTATESINSGHTLSFRGNLTPNDTNGIGTFTINKKCNLKGNCMSMLFGDNAADNYSLSGKNYAFYKLFYNCSNIVNVSSNFLPATTLTDYCYQYMFYGCKSLITATELPATTLAIGCYSSMFVGCKSLITATELPATTLADNCYSSMFNGCTSLTTAPELPAATLYGGCYSGMFWNCTSLTKAPALPVTTLAGGCYAYMFWNCTSLTTAPELPATTLASECYSGMFNGCTSLNYIKCLATDISASNYTYDWVKGVASTGTFVKAADMTGWTTGSNGIPRGWTVEEYIDYTKEPLTFNILSAGTINWTASNTDIAKTIDYKLNDGNWTSVTSNTGSSASTITVNSGDKIQFRGDNTAYCGDNPELYSTFGDSTAEFEIEGNIMSLINSTDFSALTTLESNFTFASLFSNCTGLTSAENLILPATPLTMGCYLQMFYGCSSLTTAPELPATTLAMGCYTSMFEGCGSLTTAPALPATTLAPFCYAGMFVVCTSLTTAPELPATTLANNCYDSMFIGCTSLNYIKCLATDISATNCTNGWVDGVAATGTFVQNPGMDEWETGVNGIPVNWTVEGHSDFSTKPLTFNILSDGTINWTASDASITKTIEYKLNNGEWTSIISNTGSSAPTINVIKGDKLQLRGNNAQYATDYYSMYNSFSGSTALFEAKGNIMSLIYGDDFKNKLTISSTYAFTGLFRNCTKLVSAKNLVLPATTLADYCYYGMFWNCTSLTTAPSVLPATTLASSCYAGMFQDCTSLTTVPKLPATDLAESCYTEMFWNCTSLTTVPSNLLPATTLTSTCYQNMFRNCSSLTVAPELPATTLADSCYLQMFYDCTSLTTAPSALPATTLARNCYSSMFNGCTSLTTAPTLPSTILADYCYSNMFQGCTKLTTAPALPATTLAMGCYDSMFKGCTSLTTAPVLPATSLTDYCYDSMFIGCKSLTTAPALPATTLGRDCYGAMFSGCSSLTTAPELPATTLALFCYSSMFAGCTSLTTAPALPATTLANYCYSSMFYKCRKLNYIKCLATNISATNCTNGWVDGVASTGTFVKAAGMTSWKTGTSGIPRGWTVEEYIDYTKEPLTFNILSAGTINWIASKTSITKTIDYKLNGGEWVSITSNTGSSAPTITVNSGDKLQFRGNNAQYATGFPVYNSFGGSTASFEVEGNIMSLIYGDDFKNKLTISSAYTFTGLFRECANLVSAENLILPATTLANGCYLSMFRDCTKLTTVPELPATTLAQNCYSTMFKGCTSLTTVPSNLLPATTLAENCYSDMFWNCTSLTTVPVLPATTLANYCYSGMFHDCTSLTTVPSNLLPVTTLADYCYSSMFMRCTSLTTAPELPATTLASTCYQKMFEGCTSLETAPELPATTLVDSCYSSMFNGCTSLNYIKCLATDISAGFCTNTWVNGVASTGTFVKASSMTSWSTSPYGIPSGWTVQDA